MITKSKIKILGITIGSYPYGGAASTRNLVLFKGLKELNYNVLLLSIYPDKNHPDLSMDKHGIYNKVPYTYAYTSIYQKNIIIRLLQFIWSTLICVKVVLKSFKDYKIIVINYIKPPLLSFFLTIICRFFKIPVFHEVTEYPFIRLSSNFISNYFYLHFTIPLFAKLYVISNALKVYFSSIIDKEKITIINMIVDPAPFDIPIVNELDFDYIAYCGSMNTDKDGVPILIEAFSIIQTKFPEIKLVLIGDIKNRPIHTSITNTINKYNLQNKVHFTGFINNSDLPKYLKGAKLLALARPDNIQAKGGFPTKLGEYLASGTPVIVSPVGEIPFFIKHKVNGYVSPPIPKDFAKTMIDALKNYTEAKKIGQNGKKLVFEEFNYYKEAKKIDHEIKVLFKTE